MVSILALEQLSRVVAVAVGLSGRIPSQPLQEILGAQAAVRVEHMELWEAALPIHWICLVAL